MSLQTSHESLSIRVDVRRRISHVQGEHVGLTFCADQGAKLPDNDYVSSCDWIIVPIELNCELHQNMKMKFSFALW